MVVGSTDCKQVEDDPELWSKLNRSLEFTVRGFTVRQTLNTPSLTPLPSLSCQYSCALPTLPTAPKFCHVALLPFSCLLATSCLVRFLNIWAQNLGQNLHSRYGWRYPPRSQPQATVWVTLLMFLFDMKRPGLADISVYSILSWIKTWVKMSSMNNTIPMY